MFIKHILCDCKCKFNSKTINSNQKWNNDKFQCECKWYHARKEDYSWNPSARICVNSRYLKRIADESVVVCDEVININKFDKYIYNKCHEYSVIKCHEYCANKL